MIGTPAVTVLINGALVDGSADARLEGDVVVAPRAPYLRSIADRIETGGGRIVFERAGRVVTIIIGSPIIRSGDATQALPIAPYVRAGEALIPLAAVARALGASVDYNGATRTINVATIPAPLVSMTPDLTYRPPAEPLETFTPQPTPAPPVVATGTPRPRRTPIVVVNARPSVTAPP